MKNYYTKRKLSYGGKHYGVGEKLNHKLGLRDQQILNTMVRMGKLTTEQPVDVPPVDDKPLPPVDDKPLPPVDDKPLPPVDDKPLPPVDVPPVDVPATGAEMKHTGAGWYNVVLNDVVLNPSKLKGKDAVNAWAKENDIKLLTA